MSVTGDEYTDLSPVGRALDFLPKANTLVSHYFVCGIHPDDVPSDRELVIDPSEAPVFPCVDETGPSITPPLPESDGTPRPRVLFHWSGESASEDDTVWSENDKDIPPQLLDFCFPKYRKADLRWVDKSAPETAEILTKPQHETEDPFVFLISGETPLFGVCIHRKELARVMPPTTIKPRSAKKKAETPEPKPDEATAPQTETNPNPNPNPNLPNPPQAQAQNDDNAANLLIADRVPITTRCYCLISRHALLPLLHDLLSALMAADFGASSEMRRILLNYFLPLPDGQTLPPLQMPLPVRSSALVYAILRFTKNTLKVPSPGDVLHYKLPVTAPATPTVRTFRCPVGSTPPNSAMSVILEWSVLFVCSDLSVLTSVVLATLPATKPISWQGIFIPLLPATILDCLDAPVPYIIGAPFLPPSDEHPLDGVLIVDVLANKLENRGEALPMLPDKKVLMERLKLLHQRIFSPKGAMQGAQRGSSTGVAVAHSVSDRLVEYVQWIVDQISKYYAGMVLRNDKKPVSISALIKSFTNGAQAVNRPFIKAFLNTQHFAYYFHRNIATVKVKK